MGHRVDSEGKSAPISKLEFFLTEWNRSYIVLALETTIKHYKIESEATKGLFLRIKAADDYLNIIQISNFVSICISITVIELQAESKGLKNF